MQRVLFNHIGKCAGSTVNNYLKSCYPKEVQFSTDGWHPGRSVSQFRMKTQEQRYKYECITGHATNQLLGFVHPDTKLVTVLRDPVERTISNYWYMRQDKKHSCHRDAMRMSMLQMLRNRHPGLGSQMVSNLSGMKWERAEAHPANGKLAIDRAIRALGRYHLIGWVDDMEAFGHALQRLLDLPKQWENRMDNRCLEKPTLSSVSDEEIQEIRKANHLDIRFYRRARSEFYQSAVES